MIKQIVQNENIREALYAKTSFPKGFTFNPLMEVKRHTPEGSMSLKIKEEV